MASLIRLSPPSFTTNAHTRADFSTLLQVVSADVLAGAAPHPGYVILARLLDLVVGSLLLLISLPVIVVLAVLVRHDSSGPILFSQTRVGRFGRPFTFYKFRTMWVDARERFPDLYTYAYTDQEVRTMYFKQIDDPRVTPFGRLLRRTSLDELPNLINVLRGEMALVGPRPEIPQMLPYYRPHQLRKFSVKPGITGVAQISGRGLLSFQETIAADLEHCQQRSLWFDVMILWRTMKCVALRVGAF
jgi:lipopolysaccharide/colanic/teichoic acid biosynthesis glycosyltransferase